MHTTEGTPDVAHRLPAFTEPLHVGRPNMGDRARFLARVNGALDRLWLTNDGPLVREFEEHLATVAGTRYCVATCNGTNALQIAARACGIGVGDEVIVPSFTWVATAHALEWIGAVPVFCDVDEESGTADVAHLERLIGPRTRGILGVHVFGRPCDISALSAVADRAGVPLFFDAAHAVGCTYGGRPIGGFGRAEIFSFHATKYVHSFEGGAIVTDDHDIATRARAMRQQGIDENRRIAGPGTVARMNEISAAMGLTSLESIDSFTAANRRNHEAYRAGLAGVPGIHLREPKPGERSNHQYVIIEVDAASPVDRDGLHEVLTAHNVLVRKYFHPICHQVEPYRSAPERHAPLPLPRAEALAERVLALPTGTAVGPAEIEVVCAIIRDTAEAGHRPLAPPRAA
ncbi:aminotransferase class I/II-fold pyridoxal phosphate-dependent enzyme [Phytohabitans suffuscus]|uniref:dTDP-4-dehydro-6-deoxyglucose aminotransferase n=1 Tax=Phytohabitans suffuscus TaxID=624315 RepID=A0A6F8YQY3_9ACTN|nr:aminotransferase class I/II-fold pyridoxal phosphate-dependent enzyme [Phytohabitans suffuscus]BCB88502.1 dTDP-4-dehydro-6-deoxyglucose aminotransferase [Phytohabitans suffuscus]